MVSGKFIIIPIEVKVRDFLSRLKLSMELMKEVQYNFEAPKIK